jgi:hypothetical protein
MQTLRCTFKFRAHTGSFYLPTTIVTSCRLIYRINVADSTDRLYKRRGIPAENCKRQMSDKIKAKHLRRVRDVTAGHLPLNYLITENLIISSLPAPLSSQ